MSPCTLYTHHWGHEMIKYSVQHYYTDACNYHYFLHRSTSRCRTYSCFDKVFAHLIFSFWKSRCFVEETTVGNNWTIRPCNTCQYTWVLQNVQDWMCVLYRRRRVRSYYCLLTSLEHLLFHNKISIHIILLL